MFRRVSLGLAVALLATSAPVAFAQEQAQEETQGVTRRVVLQPSRELKRVKRAQAREGGWVWTGVAALAGGFSSNVFESPSSKQSAGLADLELRGEGLRDLSTADRVRVRVQAGFAPYTETRGLNDYDQSVSLFFRHRFTENVTFSLSGQAQHQSDNVLDINGNDFRRDFEYFAYRWRPSLSLQLGELGRLRLSYAFKRKDYAETPSRNSLDWWKHGPRVSFSHRFGRAFSLAASYSFSLQTYDEEPANSVNGSEPASNPNERHYLHRVGLDGTWRLSRRLRIEAGYAFRKKDDRFRDFESYDDHGGTLGLTWTPSSALALGLGGGFSHRDYDHRPGTFPGETLEFDRISLNATSRYQLSPNLALFALYSFTDRDTNRDTGISYRSYTDHTVLSGVTVAF